MEQFGNMAEQKGLLGNKSLSSTFVALSPEYCVTSERMPALAVVFCLGGGGGGFVCLVGSHQIIWAVLELTSLPSQFPGIWVTGMCHHTQTVS